MYSFFKTLVDHEVTVELKNDIQIRGILKSVDQYLNIKLDDISVVEELKYPHLVSAHSLGRMRWRRRKRAMGGGASGRLILRRRYFAHEQKCCGRTWWIHFGGMALGDETIKIGTGCSGRARAIS